MCLSVQGGGGWLPSMHHRSHDWGPASSGGSASGGSASLGACLQGRWADPGTREAGGMHPTGIHSYLIRIFAVYVYRPQRSWGKVIFSEACVNSSVHRGVCMVCGCSWGACLVALGGMLLHACPMRGCSGGHVWLLQGGVFGIRRDTEIRSMSGRYASYWNAFFLCWRLL